MKRYVCPICGYVHEGDAAPEKCPQCGALGSKFKVEEVTSGKKVWACQHEIGAGKVEDAEIVQVSRTTSWASAPKSECTLP